MEKMKGNKGLTKKRLKERNTTNPPKRNLKIVKSYGYWKKIDNQREYLTSIAPKFEVKEPTDWLKISPTKIVKIGGIGLLKVYNGSLYRALEKIYTEIDWGKHIYQLKHLPKKYWDSVDNQRHYFEYLFQQFGYKTFEDWYSLSNLQMRSCGGGALLHKYQSQLFRLLTTIYPNYPWDIHSSNSRFKYRVTMHTSQLLYLLRFYQIRTKEDWYRISAREIPNYTIRRCVINFGYCNFLRHFYPSVFFASKLFDQRSKKSAQFYLLVSVRKLFPNFWVYEEYLPPNIVFSKSELSVEFDLFIPQLNLAVEYQGEQHYDEHLGGFSPAEVYLKKDLEKFELTSRFGITLAKVPYWWDRNLHSLRHLIESQCTNIESRVDQMREDEAMEMI